MLKRLLNSLTSPFDQIIARPDDPDDVRLGKRLFVRFNLFLVLITLLITIQGIIVADRTFAIVMFLIFITFFSNMVFLRWDSRFQVHFTIFVLFTMVVPFLWSAIFGGFNANSYSLFLSFTPLLLVVLVYDQRTINRWFVGYVSLVILSGFLEPYVANPENIPSTHTFDIVLQSLSAAAMIFLLLTYYKREKNKAQHLLAIEQEKSENLLLNILPKEIAEILKEDERTIADHYDQASVLFADIVDFTPMSIQMAPDEMVGLLNEIFSHFDSLVEKYGLEKIRTIGDNYMIASGVPQPRTDHALALASMALDMLEYCKQLPSRNGKSIEFRIGINSGPLVAGIIGRKKFQYDVWGDTVNTASRMESHGAAGRIQVSQDTHDLLENEFVLESRGKIDVKGKGVMETWYLVGRRE
ncbi:MAG: adenylate/guanylate cyclase domain-containing protein [Anaerolineae bacterium]|nr:adenylate/guanylate cyclase domain-containing protein [Anaerolineae bacterium]